MGGGIWAHVGTRSVLYNPCGATWFHVGYIFLFVWGYFSLYSTWSIVAFIPIPGGFCYPLCTFLIACMPLQTAVAFPGGALLASGGGTEVRVHLAKLLHSGRNSLTTANLVIIDDSSEVIFITLTGYAITGCHGMGPG